MLLVLAGLMLVRPVLMTAAQHQVPDGFSIERVAGEPLVIFPMFAAFDERGRLFVAESSGLDLYAELNAQTRKCRVKLLEDRDGDGRFETSTVFADKLVFPMGLVWRDGKLYVADPPDLVTLEDTNGDGWADQRTVILTGFGHKDNGSLHGLTFGPDGLLYLTMGSPDGYRLKRDDGTFVEGTSGALIHCRPDGSGVKVVSRGFVNLVEIVFTGSGEIIGTDNWYQHPDEGVRDALVHLIDGGLYPFEPDNGTPQPATGEPLPPLSLFPSVALSGLAIYRGNAFPVEMRDNLFSAQHNSRKVGRHVLVRAGSTFRSENFDLVTSDDPDFHPSDVLEDADGSLVVVDTGGWYVQHCPTGRIRDSRASGGIYRVRYVSAPRVEDPRGMKLDWTGASEQQLAARLADPRPSVRDRAEQLLVRRPAIAPLTALISGSARREVKQRALWILGQIPDEAAAADIRGALKESDTEVIITACRVLARRGDSKASPDLCRLLEESAGSNATMRLAVAEALARCGNAEAVDFIWRALTNQADRFLEHALVHAAHRIANVDALNAALDHSHPKIQKAALLLLNQPPRPRDALRFDAVMACVSAPDTELRKTALEILCQRTEWASRTTALIQQWLDSDGQAAEDHNAMSSLLLAFQREAAVQDGLGAALNSDQTRAVFRGVLLDAISGSSLSPLPSSWVNGLRRAIDNPATRERAVRVAARLQIPALEERLWRLAEDTSQAVELRVEALRGVIGRNPDLSEALFDMLVHQLGAKSNPVARLGAVDLLRRSHLNDTQMVRVLATIQGDALISPGSVLPAFRESASAENAMKLIESLATAVKDGWRPSVADLDGLFKRLPPETHQRAVELRELAARSAQQGPVKLKQFEPLLTGGNPERGREVFFGSKVACGSCHSIGNDGGRVGPDLTKIGAVRSGRDILESILLPSASFAQGYDNYRITTKDAEEISGIIAQQSPDAVVLRAASGAEVQVPRSGIQEIRRSTISVMPEGLEQGMTQDEFRNLLAFLQSLK
jgi:putative membrane-bound dehydrogenase-like protein